jgi:hypothetical protein
MKFVALITVIPNKDEEKAIQIAKEAGAGATTIIQGRNIGLKEKKVFFGLTFEENVSILMFILPRKLSMKILKAIRQEFELDNHDNSSLAFTIPLGHVAGLNNDELHQFEHDLKHIL